MAECSWLTPVVSVLGGVSAAGIAAFAALRVAWSRAKVDIITAGRQKWTDALREDLAELLAVRFEQGDVTGGVAHISSDAERHTRIRELTQRVRLLRARILLRMDERPKPSGSPNPHIALAKTVRQLCNSDGPVSGDLENQYVVNGQAVIDAAWSQVKQMK